MSNRKTALAHEIDQKVVDYITEVERIQQRELDARDERNRNSVTTLTAQIQDLKLQVQDLNDQIQTFRSDDKYALTKAKLIRLMKDKGYYE